MRKDGVEALRSLEAHPVLTRTLPGRGPLTYREHVELAHAELQAALERCDHLATFLAIKSIVVTNPKAAYDRLAPYLSDERIATVGMVQVASAILQFFQARTPVGVGDESWMDVAGRVLRDDPRWVGRAIELSRRSAVERSARMLLSALKRDELDAALRRRPSLPEPPRPSYAGRRDFVSRYQAGEHEGVWRDLRSLGPIEDASLGEEAMAVATLTMQRVRRNVEAVTERLQRAGYPFDDHLPPWSPPPIDVAGQIARIEDAAGGGCPASLHSFWSVVGEVNWKHAENTQIPDAPWAGVAIAEADPLCIYGARSAWTSVEEWLERREEEHAEVVGPLEIDLAPDYLHKANISGGLPYAIRMPSAVADPPFENEEHRLPFVDYLRLCFRCYPAAARL